LLIILNAKLKMKTKARLLLILFICTMLFFLLGVLLDSVISNKIETLLEKRIEENKNEVEKLVLLEGGSAYSYVQESSYWDELCKALKNTDTSWINENMASPLSSPRYHADYLWIVDTMGANVYFKVIDSPIKDYKINFSNNPLLLDKVKSKTISTNYVKDGNYYTQITAASIVPSNDYLRKTKPLGYLIVGKIIDSNYLNHLADLNSAFKYSFASDNDSYKSNINLQEATLSFTKTIKCANAKDLNIIVKSYLPEIKLYRNFVRYSLLFYMLAVGVLIGFIFRYFIQYFFNPLEKVTKALKLNSANPIENIKLKNTELGGVARMIDDYFKQNDVLQTEIKERKKTELELNTALFDKERSVIEKIKAEQSEAAKSEFLSTMSHEIRTPINGVIGIANLLKDEKLTTQQKEYVDVLHFSANHLLSLVSDILDFSKIETGKVDFEIISFDLNQVCTSLFNLHKINAEEKNIELLYAPDTALKHSIYGDQVRLNQVLTNLLGNAIKFTEKGNVTFSYKLLAETANNCTIEFNIKDTGIGIKQEEQAFVFDGFSQANRNISREFGGTGLGLTICKKLVELQGGKINMTSEFGVGSSFTFYISFEKHAFTSINNELNVNTTNPNKLIGMKVMVAEDNQINILVIKRFLEKWGISYKIANTGLEAVNLVKEESFDLILMDLHMPEMDGEEATRLIRQDANNKINRIPIIALTANASTDTQNKLLNNGFSNYISKPFNPDNLFKLLKKYYYEN
jgi:signal transduction histidine kinase/CheY-like chemotaxis protein/sensor domain CHASE-containing protein